MTEALSTYVCLVLSTLVVCRALQRLIHDQSWNGCLCCCLVRCFCLVTNKRKYKWEYNWQTWYGFKWGKNCILILQAQLSRIYIHEQWWRRIHLCAGTSRTKCTFYCITQIHRLYRRHCRLQERDFVLSWLKF